MPTTTARRFRSAAGRLRQPGARQPENQSKVIEGNIQGPKQFETEYRARLTEFLTQLQAQVSDTNNYNSLENN